MSAADTDAEARFQEALERMREATEEFIASKPERWKALCSHADDATIVGGWGGHARGWAAVGARYDWAAARYRGGELRVERIAQGVSGDLGYTFHIEHQVARLAGVEAPVPVVLRVTHIYRREGGAWKLLHRHADPLTATQPVEAVVQR